MNARYGPLFSLEHKASYMRHYRDAAVPIANLCFNNRFAWSVDRFYQYMEIEDCACLYSEGVEDIVGQHLIFPLGVLTPEKLKTIADYYYPAFEERGVPLWIVYAPTASLPLFRTVKGYQARDEHKLDFDEYVYSAQAMRTFAGKELHSKKSQLNKFYRECNGCHYETLTRDDAGDCLALVEQWCADRGYKKDDLYYSDYLPIRTIFEHMDGLDIRGGTIRIYKKLVAFSIGSEMLDGTAFIHFEKADHRVGGSNVAIISSVLENEYPDAVYVNREEDMGVEGLRIAKKSYNPVSMTEKHDLFLTKI